MSAENFPLDTIQARINGLGDPASSVPSAWTPEHVVKRLVDALEVLRFAPDRGGPRGSAGGWPPALMAAAKARDSWLLRNVPQRVLDNLDEPVARDKDGFDSDGNPLPRYARDLPSRGEIAMMEEALAWPLTFLTNPLEADALSLYLMGKAYRSFEVKALLTERVKRQELQQLRQWVSLCIRQDREAHILIHDLGYAPDSDGYATLAPNHRLMIELYLARRKIRARIAPEVTKEILATGAHHGDRALEMRTLAEQRIMQECLAMDLAPEGFDIKPPRPNRCMTRWEVDWYRKAAAKRIAAGLQFSSTKVT